jgi:hypothetical protein
MSYHILINHLELVSAMVVSTLLSRASTLIPHPFSMMCWQTHVSTASVLERVAKYQYKLNLES